MAQPVYHWGLSTLGAIIYGFPSCSMKVIAVTGTKGKSTTVYMISKILEEQRLSVAAVGSLGFKIKDREWPNTLKMTLPGRMKLQKFLRRAKNAGCEYTVLEATSEGIVQNRLGGVKLDCAVFTNLHREHLESHGSFENYVAAKQKLFLKTKNIHILNIEDPYYEKFANFPAQKKITYGKDYGDINFKNHSLPTTHYQLALKLLGDFNQYNALAALAVAHAYGLDVDKAVATLNCIELIPGRMETIHTPLGFDVVIDYAHTPDSLKLVYQTLKERQETRDKKQVEKLICVLGAAGGGRDKWKRPEFGKIAVEYCDEIILTNEDPYDESPEDILNQIEKGLSSISNFSRFAKQIEDPRFREAKSGQFHRPRLGLAEGGPISNENKQKPKFQKIIDRREAILTALTLAKAGDIVVITGKGSETSMAVAGGRKIPWSDKETVKELLN